MSHDHVYEYLSKDDNVYTLMQESVELTMAAIRAMPDHIVHDRMRIRQLENENARLRADLAALRRQVNRKEDNTNDEILTLVKDIRRDQVATLPTRKEASVCPEVASILDRYRTARPTNLSDLVGLLNDYVEDEDQYRKDELDE